jgi:hypothetical protein
MVIFSSNVEADRGFFGEVLKLPSVDGGRVRAARRQAAMELDAGFLN